MKAWKIILTVILILILVGGTNYAQYYFNNQKIEKLTADYEAVINDLSAKLEALGPMKQVLTVREGVDTYPGLEISQDMLDTINMPASFISEHTITDPEKAVKKLFKVHINHGTMITDDVLMEEPINDTMRELDIVSTDWPVGLKVGDYVDVTYTLPKGEEYIVLPRVHINQINGQTCKINITAKDRHIYNGMLVDYYLNKSKGAVISMVKYPEPGIQKAALPYYSLPENIVAIITNDPNIIDKANAAIQASGRGVQNTANNAVSQEESSVINSGRSETSSKKNGSYSIVKNKEEEKARRDEEKRREEELYGELTEDTTEGTESTESSEPNEGTSGDGNGLYIEGGALE